MISFKYLLLLAGFSCSNRIPHRIRSGEGNVHFDLVCNVTAAECTQVKDVLFTAGEVLNNVIEIKEKLLVSVKYYDFCNGNKTCRSWAVGATSHSSMQLGGKYKYCFYPQALVKQLGSEELKSGSYKKYDMEIALNAKTKFQIVGQVKFTSSETSLLSVVSHEILHGLGIASSFNPMANRQNLITPSYERGPNNTKEFVQNVFDSHLYIRENGKPVSSFMDRLNRPPKIQYRDEAILYQSHNKTIQELSTLLTTNGSVYFLTSNHNKVDIETGYTDYQPGSSVSHLDGAYVDKIESMMIPHTTNGKGIDSMSEYRGWYIAPYGPLTLEILATLGYTLKKPTWGHSLGGIIQLIRQDKNFIRKVRLINRRVRKKPKQPSASRR